MNSIVYSVNCEALHACLLHHNAGRCLPSRACVSSEEKKNVGSSVIDGCKCLVCLLDDKCGTLRFLCLWDSPRWMKPCVRLIETTNWPYVGSEMVLPSTDQYRHFASSIRLSPCQRPGQVTAVSGDVAGEVSVCVDVVLRKVDIYFIACKAGTCKTFLLLYMKNSVDASWGTHSHGPVLWAWACLVSAGGFQWTSLVPIARDIRYIEGGCSWCVAGRLLATRDAGTRRAAKGKARAITFKREV